MNEVRSPRELWKALYIAALFENQKPRISEKIAAAQAAIQARRRELTLSANDVRERHALDNALFSLEALRTCLAILPSATEAVLDQQIMAG